MTRLSHRTAAALSGLAIAVALPAAWAQGSPKSLGSGAGSGPIMTRDELRTCMNQQTELNVRRDKLEADRKALEADRAAIVAENEVLKGQQGKFQQAQGNVAEVNARTQALSERVSDWNARMQQFEKENRTGPFADRQRRQLMSERAELDRENEALNAARGGVSGASPEEVKAYNERAAALQARSNEWNERNKRLVAVSEKLADDRAFWASDCGNRRYLDTDEAAIRQGK